MFGCYWTDCGCLLCLGSFCCCLKILLLGLHFVFDLFVLVCGSIGVLCWCYSVGV